MTKKLNREIEQHYFEMFRRDYQLPKGTVTYKDKPDVILDGKRKIGIEITNFFIENGALTESEQVQRRVREAVIIKAQEIYLDNSGKRIELSFSFNKQSPIRDQKKLAGKIAMVAKNIDGLKTGEISKHFFEDIPEVSFIHLNAKEYENPKWHIIQCYQNQIMSIDKLREIISIKETQSKAYEHCDTYWLLIVVDFFDRAQDQEIRIDGLEKIDSAVFEKVIVYKTLFGQVFEAKG